MNHLKTAEEARMAVKSLKQQNQEAVGIVLNQIANEIANACRAGRTDTYWFITAYDSPITDGIISALEENGYILKFRDEPGSDDSPARKMTISWA